MYLIRVWFSYIFVNIKKNQYEKNKDKQAKQHQTYVLQMNDFKHIRWEKKLAFYYSIIKSLLSDSGRHLN